MQEDTPEDKALREQEAVMAEKRRVRDEADRRLRAEYDVPPRPPPYRKRYRIAPECFEEALKEQSLTHEEYAGLGRRDKRRLLRRAERLTVKAYGRKTGGGR